MTYQMKLSTGNEFCETFQDTASVMSCCKEAILRSIHEVITYNSSKTDLPITIADFGTADGSVAKPILNEIIDAIRQTFSQREVVLILEEQPETNFNALIKSTCGLIPNQKCSLKVDDNISVLYSATSMYKRCCPSEYLDLVICTVALHWLSKLPCNICNGIFDCEANDEELLVFKKQAAMDYENFLINRGEELKHGGKMVIGTLARFPDGRYTEGLKGGFSTKSVILQNMRDLDVITQKEFEDITCPLDVGRSERELRYPFESDNTDILRLGLSIESLKFKETTYAPGLKDEDSDEESLDKYAESIVATIKPWLYNTIYSGLEKMRTDAEKKCIIERYFQMLGSFVRNQRPRPGCVIRFAEIVIHKK